MKANRNHEVIGNYYIGLNVGTNAVGWAVTDESYNVLKFKGNAMWGVRLFEEAQGASVRRANRTSRRRMARQKQRLLLLQMLFSNEINKVDPSFFIRMQESGLLAKDKTTSKFTVFSDDTFTDKEYHKKYPTVYHLRKELTESTQPHDIRLVYLALHHIFKSRGHFYYETSDSGEITTAESAFDELNQYLSEQYETELKLTDREKYLALLQKGGVGIVARKKGLSSLLDRGIGSPQNISLTAVSDMLSGATVKFSDLFCDATLKSAVIKSFSLKNDLEENFDELSNCLGQRVELLVRLKTVYDAALLSQILNSHNSISSAKVALYDKNHRDLKLLKQYVRESAPEKYKLIFSKRSAKLNNYAAYSRYPSESGSYTCTQEDFCKFLKKELPLPSTENSELDRIFREIGDGAFLTKLRNRENGVIPYQLHRQELLKILDNTSAYLPFLNEADADGISVKEKIVKAFEFRIPYYVGPLNSSSPNHWAIRFAGKEQEKVYPWNFESVIDTEATAQKFIANLVGLCSYTGEKVLPRDSLLYSEFVLLNELNLLRVNGKSLPYEVKQDLLRHFFYDTRRTATKKDIRNYLLAGGHIAKSDVISGIDVTVKASLRSYHDFRDILDRTGDVTMVEDIIRSVLVFSKDKSMLRRWLKKNTRGLTETDINHICRLKYSDWGRFSETLLSGIRCPDGSGNAKSIMDLMEETNQTLSELMSSKYDFAEKAAKHRNELLGCNQTLAQKLDGMYLSPAMRRSLRQTLRIVDEVVDARKAAPSKIFIEIKSEHSGSEQRKKRLLDLYKNCPAEHRCLLQKLESEDETRLHSDKLYLYYLQFGKCMYSGEQIDLGTLLTGNRYDIDHIFPRSRVRDNSLDNRVLVRRDLNREKTNGYPLSPDIRSQMQSTWSQMRAAGFISQNKYERLTRSYPLTTDELSSFVVRQLTEAQHSTKALTALLQNTYKDSQIVYTKAENVSSFRNDFDLLKCRDVNDLYHAKDAYLNIVVGNVYATKFNESFFSNIRNEKYSLNRVFAYDTPGAWDTTKTFVTVNHHMLKNNVLVSRMPREAKGQLFDLQVLPAGNGQLPKKAGLPIEDYGGYNRLTGTWFCAVEYTDKKRIRTLQPVYLYQKALFEKDPVRYCEEVLGLNAPRIIAEKVRFDSMLELNGKRLLITGRSGSQLLYKHTYQLAIDPTHEKYIRAVSKYVTRCSAQREELPVTRSDGLTVEQNADLYEWFLEKCDQRVYADFLKNMKADMLVNRDTFDNMSVLEQCKLLMEILKAFRCNSQVPDFTALCGKGTVAQIKYSSNLGYFKSAYLIDQSVTGLYEYKTNLLL